MSASAASAPAFDPAPLLRLLDGPYGELRQQIRDVLCRPEFAPVIALPTGEYHERVLEWAKQLAHEGIAAPGFPAEYGGQDDFGANVAAFELPGCFAMTEAGHGSDVQDLHTTATYDPDGDAFVVHTPDAEAYKDCIGNAACHGRMAAVFAKLIVGGETHGVHALVVPLRDGDGNLHQDVRIEDSGEKMGMNGVDNGRIWFDQVRVPREALLNRYGEVDEQGDYTSPIENANQRFFTMLGTLVQGRVCVSGASISAAKSAITITTRYGLRRRQSGRRAKTTSRSSSTAPSSAG